jgi:hypothetical protein
MYHEEKIIDGVLHWRGTPDEEWIAYTIEQLTSKWYRLRMQLKDANITPDN